MSFNVFTYLFLNSAKNSVWQFSLFHLGAESCRVMSPPVPDFKDVFVDIFKNLDAKKREWQYNSVLIGFYKRFRLYSMCCYFVFVWNMYRSKMLRVTISKELPGKKTFLLNLVPQKKLYNITFIVKLVLIIAEDQWLLAKRSLRSILFELTA